MSEGNNFQCFSCGGRLMYQPATTILKCIQCSNEYPFDLKQGNIDFIEYDNKVLPAIDVEESVQYVNCNSCGAQIILSTTLKDNCPFCSNSILNNKLLNKQIKQPLAIIPFQISREHAYNNFIKWLKKIRFAPNNMIRYIRLQENLKGVYLPYYLINYSANIEYNAKETGKYGQRYSGKRKVELRNIALIATDVIPKSFKEKWSGIS